MITLQRYKVESRRNKFSKESCLYLVDCIKIWLTSHQNISLKLKLYFYKPRQPQQIAVVILINQLASVDQTVQDFKGVALNSGLYPFRKLLYFPIHFFTIRHYCFPKKKKKKAPYISVSIAVVLKYGPPLNMRCSYPALERDVLNRLQLLLPLIKFKEEQKGLCS